MLIGISGKLKSGKDLFYQYLIQSTGRKLEQKKWAYKMKLVICIITGCTMEQLEDQDFKDTYMSDDWNRWMVHYLGGHYKTAPASKWFATRDEAEACRLRIMSSSSNMHEYYLQEHRITYRQCMQEIGTDLFRDKFHPNTWLNAMFVDWKPVPERGEHWLGHAIEMSPLNAGKDPDWAITDTRFPNEAEKIKSKGGLVFRINRPRELRNPDPKIEHHASETSLDNYTGFDAIIENDGTLGEFFDKVTDIVNKFNLKST